MVRALRPLRKSQALPLAPSLDAHAAGKYAARCYAVLGQQQHTQSFFALCQLEAFLLICPEFGMCVRPYIQADFSINAAAK
jgi:hypothetical protein